MTLARFFQIAATFLAVFFVVACAGAWFAIKVTP